MNLFAFTSLISFITSIFIALLFFFKVKKKDICNNFGWTCIAGAIWLFGAYKFSATQSEEIARFWIKIAHVGIILTPTFYFHFIFNITKNSNKTLTRLIYLSSVLFISYVLFYHGFYTVEYSFNQFYFFRWDITKNPTPILFYISFYGIFLFYAFLLLIKSYLASTGIQRNQIKYFIIASMFAWLGPEGMFLYIVFGIPIYPYSNIFIAVYPIILAYAILKYRLMDMTVAITRAGLFIFIYTLILGLPFGVVGLSKGWLIDKVGAQWWAVPLGLMAVLATVGPFVYIFLQRKAEDRLLKEQRRYQETLKHASVGMTRIRNLRKLLDLIAHIVTKTVRISYAAIYLYDRHTNECVLQVSRDKGRVTIPKIAIDNPLINWLTLNREPLIHEEIRRMAEDSGDYSYRSLEESMRVLGASVVIPSFLEDKFMGLFVLGDKKSGQIYTPDDLNVFEVLASQAALAIENAQFYEEAKEMHEQIAQAEKMATIGTMADGLSHQINNRFYALSLIAGDSIDTIKLTDTSKCSPEIKDMIQNINYALGRIQANVIQGGDVVRGLLKYSRKGDEGLEALKLNDIIDNTLEMVQFKVKLSEIDLIRDFPADLPKIKGNMTQLNEAFFNFIDNAYDAIVERRTTLKEPGYRGKITISAKPIDSYIQIIIQDNGMGIKEDNNKKVFTPFFTTKISSRKGTGLGLYVIRRIIIESHHGKIAFHSEHAVGTRFTLELPVAK